MRYESMMIRSPKPRPSMMLALAVAGALMLALLWPTASAVAQQGASATEEGEKSVADEFDLDDLDEYESDDDEEEEEEVDRRRSSSQRSGTPSEAEEEKVPLSPYGNIEEIVVTGTASQSLGDLSEGDSIVQFSNTDLEAIGAQNIADIADFTPNLSIVTGNSTAPTLFIRGVGLNDFNANSTSAVAVYQDDVLRNSQGLQLPSFFDVGNVNVLRGPQGYGSARNASAGAIKLYSAEPSGDFGGYLRGDYGTYSFTQVEGAVEAPIVDDVLRGRVAFIYTGRDGFMKNRCGNAPPMADREPFPRNFQDRMNKMATDEPWSICGETVEVNQISDIPEGLPEYVNDLGYWSMRGTMIFEPTDTVRFRLIGQGQQIDQYTNLGQAYGTTGFTCLNDDIANCYGPIADSLFPNGSRILGTLGGTDAGGYQPREVRARLEEIAPCLRFDTPTCVLVDRPSVNDAYTTVAQELAKSLDSEPLVGDFNRAGRTTNDSWGVSLKSDFELPNALSLTSVTAYDTYDRLVDIDLDFSPNTLFQIITEDELWQFYEDVKLTGDYGDFALGNWDIGAYALVESLHVVARNDFGNRTVFGVAGRDYTQDLYSFAAYFDTTFEFWDDFVLDGGVRWNYDRKTIDYELERANQLLTNDLADSWHAPTGSARLTYNFRADTSAYWKYTRGWKGGHYNATSSDVTQVSIADPETNNAFEVGMQGVYFDGLVQASGAFFYYSYDNYQIFIAQQFLGGQPEFVIINANDAEVYGVEADLASEPWEGGSIRFNFAWLETQFLDFVQEQQTSFPTATNERVIVTRELQNSGNPLLNSPRFSVSLSLAQTLDMGRFGSLTPRWDGAWKSVTYYDATAGRGIPNPQDIQFLPENTIGQEAYWLHNLRLTYKTEAEDIEVAFWVRNVADKRYKTFGFDGSTFNNTTIYFVGNPRVLGGSIKLNF